MDNRLGVTFPLALGIRAVIYLLNSPMAGKQTNYRTWRPLLGLSTQPSPRKKQSDRNTVIQNLGLHEIKKKPKPNRPLIYKKIIIMLTKVRLHGINVAAFRADNFVSAYVVWVKNFK